MHLHHSDITWELWRLTWPGTQVFLQQLVQDNNVENTKSPRHLSAQHLIPLTKSHLSGKRFRISVGNNIVDHSDVAGASPVGAAPTASSLST